MKTPSDQESKPSACSAAKAVKRLTASMKMNFEAWHEGTGYDLGALTAAGSREREALESLLLSRGAHDWRDAQALAALDTLRAHAVLRRAFDTGDEAVCMAVLSHTPEVSSEREREAFLVQLLDGGGIDQLLTGALLVIEHFHPRAVVLAIVRALKHRDGVTASHLAAMLYYLQGKTREPFALNLAVLLAVQYPGPVRSRCCPAHTLRNPGAATALRRHRRRFTYHKKYGTAGRQQVPADHIQTNPVPHRTVHSHVSATGERGCSPRQWLRRGLPRLYGSAE